MHLKRMVRKPHHPFSFTPSVTVLLFRPRSRRGVCGSARIPRLPCACRFLPLPICHCDPLTPSRRSAVLPPPDSRYRKCGAADTAKGREQARFPQSDCGTLLRRFQYPSACRNYASRDRRRWCQAACCNP